MTEEYNDRIIAFIDLQGFTKEVEAIRNEADFTKLKNMLTGFKSMEKLRSFESFRGSFTDLFTDEDVKNMGHGYRCTAISDSIIFSYPVSSATLFALVLELVFIQWVIVSKMNFLIRGFITVGKCHHENGVIFGDGYIRAYKECESNDKHKMPCIALDKSALDLFTNEHFQKIEPYMRDDYQYPYLNYVLALLNTKRFDINNRLDFDQVQSALSFIRKGMKDNSNSEYVLKKYQWTQDYLEYMLSIEKNKSS